MALVNRLLAAFGLVAALVVLAVPAAAQAFSLTDQLESGQYFALVNRVDSFDKAMKTSDMTGVLGVVPPKMLEKIAASNNVTVEQLIAATQEQINAAMASMTIESFGMDLKNATFVLLADDSPYALIPTETVIDMGEEGGKYRAKSTTLGLLDGDTWYLVRVEDQAQVVLLKEIYPAFADVVFPTGSMEPVAE